MPNVVISVPVWDNLNPTHTINVVRQMTEFVNGDWLLVIVDNGSPNVDTQNFLSVVNSLDSRVHVIHNDCNKGYGCAANQGISYGFERGCEYGIVLNNDVLFNEPNWIELAFVQYLRGHKDWLMGARLIRDNGLTNFGNGLIPYIEGYCLAFHRDLWNTLRGMDDRFLAYMEDVDLCYRAQMAGFQLVQSPAFEWLSDGNLSCAIFAYGAITHIGGQTGYMTPDFNWRQVTIDSARYFKNKWQMPKMPIAEWN